MTEQLKESSAMFNLTIIRENAGPKGAEYAFSSPEGDLHLSDLGSNDPLGQGLHAVLINFGKEAWVYQYGDGQEDLLLVINEDGELSLQGNGNVVALSYAISQ